MSNPYKGLSMDASYQVSVHLANSFPRRFFRNPTQSPWFFMSFHSFRCIPLVKRHKISITRGRSIGLPYQCMKEPIKLYHLRLRVECTLFCNLQSRTRTQVVLEACKSCKVMQLSNSLSHPGPSPVLTIFKLYDRTVGHQVSMW